MQPAEMPKAILTKEDGTDETIDDYVTYHFYLERTAKRIINELKQIEGLDDCDINFIIRDMDDILTTRLRQQKENDTTRKT